jgi:hypothetical protein
MQCLQKWGGYRLGELRSPLASLRPLLLGELRSPLATIAHALRPLLLGGTTETTKET